MDIFKKIKNNKGFTLVELIVVMLIMAIFSGVIYQLFITSNKYMRSIDELNDYQNITTDVIYQMRIELADCADVETFLKTDTEADGTLKYDPANLGTQYGYIVTSPVVVNADGTSTGGGAIIRGIALDGAGATVRTADEVVGQVGSNRPYRLQISLRSSATGEADVIVSVIRTDYKNPSTGNYEAKEAYTQKTKIKLRSAKASSGQEVLRYSIAKS